MAADRGMDPTEGDVSPDASQDYHVPKVESWPLWYPVFGVSDPQKLVEKRVSELIKVLPRAPTQAEIDALTELVAKDEQWRSTSNLSVVAAGAFLAWKRGFHRLPFWKLDPKKYHELVFPSRANPLIVGEWARRMWFGTRLLAYSTVIMPSALIIRAVAMGSTANHYLRQDSRLAEFSDAITHAAMQKRGASGIAGIRERARRMSSDELRQTLEDIRNDYELRMEELLNREGSAASYSDQHRKAAMEEMTTIYRELQRFLGELLEAKENPALAERQRADYESLGGGSATPSPPSSSTTNTLGPPPGLGRPQPKPAGSTQGWGASPSLGDAANTAAADDDDLDDASPVARSARKKEAGAGVSAWDRVRQQAARGQNQARSTAADGDWGSTTVQGEDSEEKRNAQREFDELVERARRGEA